MKYNKWIIELATQEYQGNIKLLNEKINEANKWKKRSQKKNLNKNRISIIYIFKGINA